MKTIQSIIFDTVKHGEALFNSGDIDEAPTRIDVMAAMIIDSTKNKLDSRNGEVTKYVVEYEDVCKYAKPVPKPVIEFYRSKF
ncbi:hypothetical protein JC221_021 [Yersinia phage JC221]|nr:hypothetical protein JC221_021 [Yersinia phage JC221]